jgi:hypothetical protein
MNADGFTVRGTNALHQTNQQSAWKRSVTSNESLTFIYMNSESMHLCILIQFVCEYLDFTSISFIVSALLFELCHTELNTPVEQLKK